MDGIYACSEGLWRITFFRPHREWMQIQKVFQQFVGNIWAEHQNWECSWTAEGGPELSPQQAAELRDALIKAVADGRVSEYLGKFPQEFETVFDYCPRCCTDKSDRDERSHFSDAEVDCEVCSGCGTLTSYVPLRMVQAADIFEFIEFLEACKGFSLHPSHYNNDAFENEEEDEDQDNGAADTLTGNRGASFHQRVPKVRTTIFDRIVSRDGGEICRTNVFRFEPIDWIDLLFICGSLAPDVMGGAMLDLEGSGLDRHQAVTLGCRIDEALESGTLNVHLKRRDGWMDLYGCLDGPSGEEGFYDLGGEPLPGYTPAHDETVVLKQELEDFAIFLKCSEGFWVSTHHFSLVARSSGFGGIAQDSQ